MLAMFLAACLWLAPVSGPVVGGFEPGREYDGHWGIDYAVPAGTEVVSPADGVVTFAGQVAGMRSVTIDAGEGLRVSVSYLSSIAVTAGQVVAAGRVVGRSGLAHGKERLHVSVRLRGQYVDPAGYFSCDMVGRGTIRLLPDR